MSRSRARVACAAALGLIVTLGAREAAAQPAVFDAPTGVSPFWPALEQLCSAPIQTLAVPPALEDPRVETALFCTTKAPPKFAAESESKRLATLDELYRAAGRPRAAGPMLDPNAPSDAIDRSLPGEPSLGPTGNVIALKVIEHVCENTSVAAVLPLTCEYARRTITWRGIRRAVIGDAVGLATHFVRPVSASPGVARAMAILDLVAELLALKSPADVAEAVLKKATDPSRCGDAACAQNLAVARVVAEIVVRIGRDGPTFDRPLVHYERIVADVLRPYVKVQGPTGAAPTLPLVRVAQGDVAAPVPTPSANISVAKLIEALRVANVKPTDGASLARFLASELDAFGEARKMAGAVLPPPSSFAWSDDVLGPARQAAQVVAAERAIELADALSPTIRDLEAVRALPSGTADGVRLAARLADVRTQDDVERLGRELVFGLPPWTDPFVADINASFPILESSEFRLNGDLTLGYNANTWGVVARGSAYNYELLTRGGLTDTVRYDGEASGYGYIPIAPKLRAELRGLFGASFYDTTTVSSERAALFVDQTSVIVRAEGIAGLRWDATDRAAFALQGGLGVQSETWDENSISANGAAVTYVGDERSPTTVRAEGRFRAQWNMVPDVVSSRLRVDLNSLAISRSDTSTTITVGSGVSSSTGTSVSSERQLEVFARLFFDIDAARVVDFRPSVHAGLNYIEVAGINAVAPVFGLGIRRESF